MSEPLKVTTMAEYMTAREIPEILFWVGCAVIFDDKVKKVTKALVKILNHTNVKFASLGIEESCTENPAKSAGNEFYFNCRQ
ncbi:MULTISPECIES: heterodisulfide reductase-related iron-sulfur binding cluster [unclassified Mucilaginibacter]|uniref:heterodisulfide reductase-related iron-sulfur binding cluster n=1 Tax=unclassified Mucilaginibacter TaxID=2617802 RepID=UPI002AC94846|nr:MULTISPECIES: heterodisulfide reductase-related iron-sulfur binding cluster [unclassified Mucilaginibacter]WPX22390.1 heterodisulfide reductase-related iron-sulfur binding cluster [Mucilaginibacter sp. 5C4]